MEFTLSLASVAAVGSAAGIAGYFLMRKKFLTELAVGKKREEELQRKVLEISDLKEAEDRLQEVLENEKGRLAQAVESLSDGILMVDEKYNLLLSNKKLRQFLEIAENPKIYDVVNALSGKFDLRTKVEEALEKEEPLAFEEVVIFDKVLQVSACRVLDAKSAKPMEVVVLFHDITDSKSLEKLRQDFMAVMVHELRSPLTTIKSTVEFLGGEDLKKMSEGELKDYFTTIDSTSQSMLELVNDLLDMAKLEAGKFEVVCENADLAAVLAERIESYKTMAASKKLKLLLEVGGDLPQAHFDKIRIKQVLNNLISNALKYTQNGEIKVKANAEVVNGIPIDILVSVADTGIGIDPKEAGRLFSRFSQLEDGMRRVGNKGTGLGLFIAKGIVEAIGGKIWVKSAGVGMGSTFYFTVPLAARDVKIGVVRKDAAQKHIFNYG